MTVGELKKRLEDYPDDMPVVVKHSSIVVEKDYVTGADDFELVCETGYGVHYDGLLKNLEQGVRYVYENGDTFPDDCDNHEEDEPYWRYKNFTKFKIDSDCTITARYEYADVKLVIGEYQSATLNLDSDIGANLYDECLLIC